MIRLAALWIRGGGGARMGGCPWLTGGWKYVGGVVLGTRGGGGPGPNDAGAVVVVGDFPDPVPPVAAAMVRFRFQQSGYNFFCSSARSLARWLYPSRSSCGRLFQASPNSTLIALREKRIHSENWDLAFNVVQQFLWTNDNPVKCLCIDMHCTYEC